MLDIVWAHAAREQFLTIWEEADAAELPAIESAMQAFFAGLDNGPRTVGESRDGPRRVVVGGPLTIWFEVLDAGRRVRIASVRRPARRG